MVAKRLDLRELEPQDTTFCIMHTVEYESCTECHNPFCPSCVVFYHNDEGKCGDCKAAQEYAEMWRRDMREAEEREARLEVSYDNAYDYEEAHY